MILRHLIGGICVAAVLGGCAIKGTPILEPGQVFVPDVGPPVPTSPPLVESPPLEPVPPPPPEQARAPLSPAAATPSAASSTPVSASTESPATPDVGVAARSGAPNAETASGAGSAPRVQGAAAAPTEPTEDQQMLRLLGDLQRYGTLQPEELKREIAQATAALGREHSDVNRLRLAVLYTMLRTSPQDDQRALQLLEVVSRAPTAAPAVRYLAAVLQAQVIERQRAVKTEQQKGDAAIQKLEALRAMEQSLFRDRVRSGGDGGGGGGGSGR